MQHRYFLLPLLFLLSCTAGRYAAPQTAEAYPVEQRLDEQVDASVPPGTGRLVVYDAYLRLVVPEPEATAGQLLELAKRSDGYALEIGTDRAVLRVPATQLDETLEAIALLGKVRNRNLSGRDVTDQFVDLEARLRNAQATQKRFRELLAQATNVTEVLAVEAELARINFEVESLQGQINRLEEVISFATITIRLEEKVRPGPVGAVFKGLYEGVKWLFVW